MLLLVLQQKGEMAHFGINLRSEQSCHRPSRIRIHSLSRITSLSPKSSTHICISCILQHRGQQGVPFLIPHLPQDSPAQRIPPSLLSRSSSLTHHIEHSKSSSVPVLCRAVLLMGIQRGETRPPPCQSLKLKMGKRRGGWSSINRKP